MGKFHVKLAVLLVVGVLLAAQSLAPVLAQDDDPPPVVYAVMFYSPTCAHCHKVMTEDYPKMREEFGDQFVVLFIDASTPTGNQLFNDGCDAYDIPPEGRGVPMMFLGEHVLVGDIDIPGTAPVLVREGLREGGIGYPNIPGIGPIFESAVASATQQALEIQQTQPAQSASSEATPEAPDATEENPAVAEGGGDQSSSGTGMDAPGADTFVKPTLSERLAHDPIANTLAIGVLLGLVVSAVGLTVNGFGSLDASEQEPPPWLSGETVWRVSLLIALLALGLSITLLFQPAGGPLAMPMALGAVLSLLVAVGGLLNARSAPKTPSRRGRRSRRVRRDAALPAWLLPVVAVGGLMVAVYLAYVEIRQVEATCGAVGDCNTVQSSEYAHLFGVLPIGVLGVIGNVAILLAWTLSHLENDRLVNFAHVALLGMTLFGVLFSTYLTFLEPFIIGATCIWCLTSAVNMALLWWLEAPAGWRALRSLTGG
jgi:uncharacterized membrane protein